MSPTGQLLGGPPSCAYIRVRAGQHLDFTGRSGPSSGSVRVGASSFVWQNVWPVRRHPPSFAERTESTPPI